MTFFGGLIKKILLFFGIGEEEQRQEVMKDYRNQLTKEKLAELGAVIDEQLESFAALEARWQETYDNMEAFIRQRDEKDRTITAGISLAKTSIGELEERMKEDAKLGEQQRERLQTLFEESRFYVGMTESIEGLLAEHRVRLLRMSEQTNRCMSALGSIGGITLQAAMLSARFGEDAAEFAAVCDRIREQTTVATGELSSLTEEFLSEEKAYEETEGQLLKLKEELLSHKDKIAIIFESARAMQQDMQEGIKESFTKIDGLFEGIIGQTNQANADTHRLEESLPQFYALNDEEAAGRAKIEGVAAEIHELMN